MFALGMLAGIPLGMMLLLILGIMIPPTDYE
jgi:hypothetical protein